MKSIIAEIVLSCILATSTAGSLRRDIMDDFLVKYGYMAPSDSTDGAPAPIKFPEEKINAIKMMQRKAGLPMTGLLDQATRVMLSAPRCGMPDMSPSNGPQSYSVRKGWDKSKNPITYRIVNFTPDIPDTNQVKKSFQDAFKLWSDASPLQFKEDPRNTDADIIIKFASGDHGDPISGTSFDGKGKTLAHAYFPGTNAIDGDAHFDEDETWAYKNKPLGGTDLYAVAAHEFGHALGIEHSEVKEALMYPYYAGYDENLKLHSDDISAIQKLYGRPGAPTTMRPPPPTRPPYTPKCFTSIDAIATIEGYMYIFKDEFVWKFNHDGTLMTDYPVLLKSLWKGFPSDVYSVDAVYERPSDGTLVFFSGNLFWEFTGSRLKSNFPSYGKPLTSLGLPAYIIRLDAALSSGFYRKTYVFSGNKYWALTHNGSWIESGYPKSPLNWRNIPLPFDGADSFKGSTYIFRGNKYTIFQESELDLVSAASSKTYTLQSMTLCSPANMEQLNSHSQSLHRYSLITSVLMTIVAALILST